MAEEREIKIEVIGRQSKSIVRRYFSRRSQVWRTSIQVESTYSTDLAPVMSIEGAEDLIVNLQKAIEEAKRITPPSDEEDEEVSA